MSTNFLEYMIKTPLMHPVGLAQMVICAPFNLMFWGAVLYWFVRVARFAWTGTW